MARDPFNFNWIEEGKLLAGSMPTSALDLKTLRDMGIRSIVGLTRRSLMDCDELLKSLSDHSLWYFHYPLSDGDRVEHDMIKEAIRVIDHEVSCGLPVYIHCRAGVGRTGTVLIAYYMKVYGLSLVEAYKKARLRRSSVSERMADDLSAVQHEYLKKLVPTNPAFDLPN